MKKIKYSLIGLALAGAGLTGCQNSYDAPELETPVATLKSNTTLLEFKEMMNEALTAAGVDGLEVPTYENGDHYIIKGRVVSSDASGNIYQSLAIQDGTAALNLSIREGSMWTNYRIGQEVVIDATGLYMGSYNGLYQLGWLDTYNDAPSITFMSWFEFQNHSEKNGLPNQDITTVAQDGEWPSDHPYCVLTSIDQLAGLSSTSPEGLAMMSQLVEIQNVYFELGGKEIYAPYQENNVRRYVKTEGSKVKLTVNNSGYSNFRADTLPVGTGSVRGILGYYGTPTDTTTAWQITLRDLNDVMFDGRGTEENPYTVTEALEWDNNGRKAWTQGYIVGSIKAGVATVTSSDDIIFGADAEDLNNVVIAASADERDWTKCMAVELKGKLRSQINLVAHPEFLGELLAVKGTYADYLGMNGIVYGSDTEFYLQGVDLPGTKTNPYSVADVLQMSDDEDGIWVEGYIVGYVDGGSYDKGATFALPDEWADYSDQNIILSSLPAGQAGAANSLPVNCTFVRETLGLMTNPANFGLKVMIKGNTGSYLGSRGLTTVSEYSFVNQEEY